MFQKGGLDIFRTVPKFKYTFNPERRAFVECIYPYSDYFMICLNTLKINEYSFNGLCEYTINNTDESSFSTAKKTRTETDVVHTGVFTSKKKVHFIFLEVPYMNC